MRSPTLVMLLSFALTAAAPAGTPTEIPWAPGEDEALIVPAASPVHFIRYDEGHVAHFRGRFVLTGTFIYGCDIECDPPLAKDEVNGSIIPDRDVAARLPHWKVHSNDIRIFLDGGDRLAAQVVTPGERAAIYAGKVDNIRKHVSIIVDDFNATLECDSATYGARFVSLATPPKIAMTKLDGDYGCGWI
jgi:hypothetical protein